MHASNCYTFRQAVAEQVALEAPQEAEHEGGAEDLLAPELEAPQEAEHEVDAEDLLVPEPGDSEDKQFEDDDGEEDPAWRDPRWNAKLAASGSDLGSESD